MSSQSLESLLQSVGDPVQLVRNSQTEIRATVSPLPYAEVVRASYRPT